MNEKRFPKHIAIIPDGNRRWAKKQGLLATKGHEKGIEVFFTVLKELENLPVEVITFWAFSTENWKRSENENSLLFSLLNTKIHALSEDMVKKGLRFRWIGKRDTVNQKLKGQLEELEKKTKENTGVVVQLCLDYGGRDEIVRAVNKAVALGKEVTQESFSTLLDTAGVIDPDLIIRTSGERRLSGFFLWQSEYAEIYFCEKPFPEFSIEELHKALKDFASRERRFGSD